MKDQKHFFYIFFLSFFGVGKIPWAPGTFGSLATVPILYFLQFSTLTSMGLMLFLAILTLLILLSCFLAEQVQQDLQVFDPQWIVIDEVLGMLCTWAFVFDQNGHLPIWLCFFFFRFFDIVKFYPASTIDKNWKSGAGTILDDIVSAVYAGIATRIIIELIKFYFN